MSYSLSDVRWKIKKLKAEIGEKKEYIKSKKDRKDDIENVISKFYLVDDYVPYYNSYIKSLQNSIDSSIKSPGKYDNTSLLNSIVEKSSSSDTKLSSAITELKSENSNLEDQINYANKELNSLNLELDRWRAMERKLLWELL